MSISKKFQEFVYSLSTNDKYSEFDSRKSFNRLNKPESEINLLYSHHNESTSGLTSGVVHDDPNSANIDGVHEVRLAWRHIKNWLGKFSPDLNSSLSSPCTSNDLHDFEKDLNLKLPNCLLEFFKMTDGQSNFNDNGSGGLIFGLKLMSIDEIAVMTENWRRVAKNLNKELSQIKSNNKIQELQKVQISHSYPNSNSASASSLETPSSSSYNEKASIPSQRSIPPGSIHASYAHPLWIPIITDGSGNCIGVDLSPPSNGGGKWGQVILFGRDFDTKYFVASNFGDFLLIFANDLELGNWQIKAYNSNDNEDLMVGSEGELVFINNKLDNNTLGNGEEVSYLEVLKNRCIKQWMKSLSEEDLKQPHIIEAVTYVKKQQQQHLNTFCIDFTNVNSIDGSINTNLTDLTPSRAPSKLKLNPYKSKVPSKHTLTKETGLDTSIFDNIVDDDSDDDIKVVKTTNYPHLKRGPSQKK